MSQVKEQDKITAKELKEGEISNIPDRELKKKKKGPKDTYSTREKSGKSQ